jgi:hypothetical protein
MEPDKEKGWLNTLLRDERSNRRELKASRYLLPLIVGLVMSLGVLYALVKFVKWAWEN